ncbi:D-2-hydroxyacid dehydrogenase [Treponema sp. OMZ 840]|uniref:D-2-hydroxyacid dehydrogenase n=1 Tax=Treponema sp. OMZ 840 TaxID=244313 RepID=UPI003D917897
MNKIVVLDGFPANPGDLSWDEFKKLGDLTVYEKTEKDKIIAHIADAAYIYTNKVPITREIMTACPHLKFIGVLATGYNTVDVEAAAEKGITVTNIPAYGTQIVAQHVFALLLEICHHAAHHSEQVYKGRWSSCNDWCFWDYPLIELAGKTMGIIGFGKIGQNTAKLAQAFGMNVLAYNRSQTEQGRAIAPYVSLDDLYKNADIISLHLPLFSSTEGMINRQSIEKMKDGVIIINTARGALVNEADMAQALNTGKVLYYATDVVSVEPICTDNPLLQAKNCIITPHIAWAAKETRRRLLAIAADNLKQFLAGTPINTVGTGSKKD